MYKDAPPEKAYAWTQAVIKSILKDETYIGNTVYNKRSSISYKNKKLVRKPEEEWMRVENTHEPIIEKAIFDQVQKQIEIRRRSLKSSKEPQMFAGLVKCADCGWSMGFGTNNSNKTPYSYFVCTKYRQFGKLEQGCSIHYVRYDVFYAYVLARIQYWAKQAELGEEELLNKVLKASDRDRAAANKKQAKELKKTERRKAELDRLFAKLYEDRVNNVISDYNFNMLSQKYQAEQAEVEEKLTRLSEELNAEKETAEDARKWIDLIKEYSNPTELNADLLNTLIEKIVVHEAVTDENGFRSQEIEIYYRFVGKID